ncbi:MAG: hypothetical protein J6Y32_06805 [Bacteroidales bacterium]|nr:hypothetical protein [Bacteroidales bacterium]
MKRILLFHFALALLLSCSKEAPMGRSDDTDTLEPGTTFFAVISEDTKTSFSPVAEGYKIFWSSGDRISIGGKEYLLSSGAGTQEGRFGPVSEEASAPYKAIYPASIRVSDTQVTLPATQDYVQGSINAYPLYAESSTTDLSFGSLCGVLRITVSGVGFIQSLTLSADQSLTGTADLSTAKGDKFPHATASGGKDTLNIQFATPLSISSAKQILVSLPVNDYTGFKLCFTNTKGYTARRSATGTISIKRAKISDMRFENFTFDRWNDHRFVDLNLPSDLRWAAWNLGATLPQERGDYYAWGATEPYYTSLSPLAWKSGKGNGYVLSNAPYYNGFTYTKYTVQGAVLESSDDAAIAAWGEKFRLPTESEWRELIGNCYWQYADSYRSTGISGFIVFKAKAGADKGYRQWTSGGAAPSALSYDAGLDANIFLPVAGYFDGKTLTDQSTSAYYFTASVSDPKWKDADLLTSNACVLYFNPNDLSNRFEKGCYERFYGFSLRPVIEKSADESK